MVRLRMLGSLDLRTNDDVPVRSVLTQPRRTALLAHLALAPAGGFRRKDSLYALFWPERDLDSARHALRQAVYFLRRSLGDGVIVSRGDQELGVAADRLWCDAAAFEAAVAAERPADALELYGGDLLDGFFVADAPEFERWVEGERSRLRDLAAGAAWRLADERERDGDAAGAMRAARRAVALEPGDEVALRRLLRLLDRLGDRVAAVLAYDEFAARLHAEYELEPSAETRELVDALRTAATPTTTPTAPRPSARPAGPTPASATPAGPAPTGAGAVTTPPTAPTTAAAPAPAPAPAPSAWRRYGRAAVLASALLVGLGTWTGLRLTGPPHEPGISPTLVAVLPFTVRGDAAFAGLGTGMANLLSSSLDGAGELRSVDPHALLGFLDGDASGSLNPAEGRRIAERFGAGMFVLGEVIEAGGHLRMRASLYDGATGMEPIARALADGRAEEVFDVVDRLAAMLLAGSGDGPRRLAHSAASTTRSLPALRAYLQGEDEFRAGRYHAALSAFDEAVAHDTAFALAYYRMGVAADWARQYVRASEAIQRAMTHLDALPGYERLLVRGMFAWNRGSAAEAEPLYHEAVAIRPSDVEAWSRLGEVLFHLNPVRGRSAEESRVAFGRVVALDPDHQGALVHLALLAAAGGRDEELESLLTHLMAAHPDHTRRWQRLRVFALGDEPAVAEALAGLRAESDAVLFEMAYEVAIHTRRAAIAERVAGLLTETHRPVELRVAGHLFRAHLMLTQGRWTAARGELEDLGRLDPATALAFRAHFSTLPFLPVLDTELEALRDSLAGPAHRAAAANPYFGLYHGPHARTYLLALVSARLGDHRAALDLATELERQPGSDADRLHPRILAAAIRARVAWDAGDPARALAALEQTRIEAYPPTLMPPGPFWIHGYQRHLWPMALDALGRSHEALRWLDASPWAADAPERGLLDRAYEAPMLLWRAGIHHRLGDTDGAAEHYARVADLWRDADPELRPMVRAAERALAGLGADAGSGARLLDMRRANELHLQARVARSQRDGRGIGRAVELLEEAVRIAPDHGPALASLALAYAHLSAATGIAGVPAGLSSREALHRASATAVRALEIEPGLVEAHLASALHEHWDRWDWAAAEAAYRRAIRIDPGHAEAHHWYALFLLDMNRPDEAIALMSRARELDPRSIVIHRNMGYLLYCAREWDAAIEIFNAIIELEPDWPLVHAWLRNALLKRGHHAEAYEAHRRHARLRGTPDAELRAMDRAFQEAGWHAVWDLIRRRTHDPADRKPHPAPTAVARVHAELGRLDDAFAWLDRALEARSIELLRLRADPIYDPLRHDPRFNTIIQQLGLP